MAVGTSGKVQNIPGKEFKKIIQERSGSGRVTRGSWVIPG